MLRFEAVKLVSLRAVCRVAALVLLCQTGLDLSVPSLCALDSEGVPHGSATSTFCIVVPATAPQPGSQGEPTGHIDDCFCCSGCVRPQAVFYISPVVRLSPELQVLPSTRVPLLPTHFFHPPQLLS